jgi:uncharacterized protein YcfL
MMRKICIAMTSTALLLLAGCVSMPDPSTNIHQPMTARPQPLALSTSAMVNWRYLKIAAHAMWGIRSPS